MPRTAFFVDDASMAEGRRRRRRSCSSMWSTTALCVVALSILDLAIASTGSIYKLTNATSKELPYNDETMLTCEMTVTPDHYQWRFYPLGARNAMRTDAPLDLSRTDFINLPPSAYKNDKKRSTLTIKMTNWTVAGDYQCLAHYGALVIASIPDRITLATMENFPPQNSSYITVASGNTILWKCKAPMSNPPAYIDYSKDGKYIMKRALILPNVTSRDSGVYKCKATNAYLDKDGKKESPFSLELVVKDWNGMEMPRFWPTPTSTYTVTQGNSVFLECNAVGSPVPVIKWSKNFKQLSSNSDRVKIQPGGLQIINASKEDEGDYTCEASNRKGTISSNIRLTYHEPPSVLDGPGSKTVKEGDNVDLSCNIRGIPKPQITWLLNGKTVEHDDQIDISDNHINFKSFEKRHGGQIQCFAINAAGITYSGGELNVYPKQVSSSEPTGAPVAHHHHHNIHQEQNQKRRKHNKKSKKLQPGSSEMIPPNKPTVSRSNDESVVVRWTVPSNNGLHITFFKVQYRELGPANSSESTKSRGSRWKTNNSDIAPNIRSFEVTGLKPDYLYKFRIAAVYSNNDNKLSPKSDRFHLKREGFYTKNPLPVPTIVHMHPINTTSIKIYWNYVPKPNVSIDGFIISYMSASSAADYMKATADGENTESYIITHLTPDTVYDIKMQSYNTKSASEFSIIAKCKTHKLPTEPPPITTLKEKDTSENDTNVYVFIGLGVGSVALILSAIVCFITCKWKQNKELEKARGDRGDKPAVEEINHHIQAEPNDYIHNHVVNPKSIQRANGCALPGNRITITANPLAEADNKNQNMIEMSCLSNNNCTSQTPSASNGDDVCDSDRRNEPPHAQRTPESPQQSHAAHQQTISDTKLNNSLNKHHRKNRDHRRRNKLHNNMEGPPPIENYV